MKTCSCLRNMIGLFLILTLPYPFHAFELFCPSPEQWSLRANVNCLSTEQYTCLPDFSDQMYNESCRGPIVALPGERRVTSNKNFDIKPCTSERYQPVTFSSKQGSACLFQKGKCSEEGLVRYGNGTSKIDRTCRCDYTRGFAFSSGNRTNPCACNAATEDCSCYKKECNGSQVLSPDYKCINETQQQGTYICSFISGTEIVKPTTDVPVNDDKPIAYIQVFSILLVYFQTALRKRFKKIIIIQPLEELQQQIEGDKVTFTCEVNSEFLRGTWFKDGQELSCSDNLDITANGRIHEIVIHRVTVDDRGYYSFNIDSKTSGGLLIVLDEFTPDKINYIRLYHLLDTVAEPVVRKIFDKEIHPSQLKKILNKNSNKIHHLKLHKHINIREYDLLYPRVVEYSVKFKIKNYDCKRIHQNNEENLKLRAEIECAVSDLYSNVEGTHKITVVAFESGSLIVVLQLESSSDENKLKKILKTAVDKGKVGSFETESTGFRFTRLGNVQAASKDFDIRLMMVLMKNLTDLNIAEVFPHKDDFTEVADLSRIKYLRNRIVQNSEKSITDEDFVDDWKHLSEAIQRLGGGEYKKKCEELKNLRPTLQHVQEYLNSENLQSSQGQTSTDSLRDLFLLNEVNNLFARDAVRRIFDKQFPPLKLEREIEARRKELEVLKEQKKITQSEWEDLFPTDNESLSSSRFDIKVMIILLSSTSFKYKDVFKTIENLQHHLSRPEYDDRAIKKAIKEINEAA